MGRPGSTSRTEETNGRLKILIMIYEKNGEIMGVPKKCMWKKERKQKCINKSGLKYVEKEKTPETWT